MTKHTFTFNSKETYLAYRADWKQRYLDHLKTVRAAKLGVRLANRAYSKDNKTIGNIWGAYSDLRVTQEGTQSLLEELCAARTEAGRQMREQAV